MSPGVATSAAAAADRRTSAAAPAIRLGPARDSSIAASIAALVERGALLRPDLAGELLGSVVLRFAEGYTPVRIDLRGDEIRVADDTDDDRAHDLLVEGALPDVVALIAAPLTGGLPRPTSAQGRAAIGRLADGRVEIDGPLRLARSLLRLLTVAPDAGPLTPMRPRRRRGTRVP